MSRLRSNTLVKVFNKVSKREESITVAALKIGGDMFEILDDFKLNEEPEKKNDVKGAEDKYADITKKRLATLIKIVESSDLDPVIYLGSLDNKERLIDIIKANNL